MANTFYAARQAIKRHASGGNILIAATIMALAIANIPSISGYYFDFWDQEVFRDMEEYLTDLTV